MEVWWLLDVFSVFYPSFSTKMEAKRPLAVHTKLCDFHLEMSLRMFYLICVKFLSVVEAS